MSQPLAALVPVRLNFRPTLPGPPGQTGPAGPPLGAGQLERPAFTNSTSKTIGRPAIQSYMGVPVTFEAYTGNDEAGNASYDCRPAFVSMLADRVREIRLKEGTYLIPTALPAISYPITIRGVSKTTSTLRFTQQSGNCLLFYSTTENCGPTLSDFTVDMYGGGNITAGIYLYSHTTSFSPDFASITRVNVTSMNASTASYPFIADGSQRTPATGLQGLRNLTIDSCEFFNATVKAFEGRVLRVASVRDTRCFKADGSTNDVNITGQGTGLNQRSDGVTFSDNNMLGELGIGNAANVSLSGRYGNIVLGVGSANVDFVGSAGNVSLNGTRATMFGQFNNVSSASTATNSRVSGLGAPGDNLGENIVFSLN